jgi:hypothetical protein
MKEERVEKIKNEFSAPFPQKKSALPKFHTVSNTTGN